jgi:hypothetical protein
VLCLPLSFGKILSVKTASDSKDTLSLLQFMFSAYALPFCIGELFFE